MVSFKYSCETNDRNVSVTKSVSAKMTETFQQKKPRSGVKCHFFRAYRKFVCYEELVPTASISVVRLTHSHEKHTRVDKRRNGRKIRFKTKTRS